MKEIRLFLFLSVLLVCCSSPKEKIPPVTIMEKYKGKVMIYQLLPRIFGNKLTVNKTYGTIEENGVGKFNDINEAALRSIRDLGITHIWYTGVLEHATMSDYTRFGIPADDPDIVKGRAGSPYAIRDYYDVDPDLATDVPNRMHEFEALISRTHANDLKVIIDFVPNHVARAYHSDVRPDGIKDLGETDDKTKTFAPDNNFYYLPGTYFHVPAGYNPLGKDSSVPLKDKKYVETPARVTGNNVFSPVPHVDDWFETVKLNYGIDIQDGGKTYFDPIPDTWLKMKDILLFWASKNVDGFRCDMAEMVPVEFWKWVIPQVREVKNDIIFIAEVYNPDQYANYINNGSFDYLYDKSLLYDTLRQLMQGNQNTRDIALIQQRLKGISSHMLHFMENHDEQRVASRFFAGDPWKAAAAMALSATIDQGPVMIYNGQEVGETGAGVEGFQGDDGRTSIFDYWSLPEHQKWMNGGKFDGEQLNAKQRQLRMFYNDVMNLAGKNPAFSEGEYFDITDYNIQAGNITDRIHAFLRVKKEERFLVVSGFNQQDTTVRIRLPQEVVNAAGFDAATSYKVQDVLWKEFESAFDKEWSLELSMKPHGCFMLKIK